MSVPGNIPDEPPSRRRPSVNRVRNRLVHFKPARGKPAWDVSDVEEIASQDACDKPRPLFLTIADPVGDVGRTMAKIDEESTVRPR